MWCMKNKWLIVVTGLALASCQNLVNNEATTAEDSASGSAITVAARDMSINANNSYSDLFLDSAAVERYIQESRLSDSTARGMRTRRPASATRASIAAQCTNRPCRCSASS